MKFDKPIPIGRGIAILLRDDNGAVVGRISSCFVSTRDGFFTSNRRPGYLTAIARVTDQCKDIVIAELTSSQFRRRADADKAFREWITENDIRRKVIDEAKKIAEC